MPDKRATMAARKLRRTFGSPVGLFASPVGLFGSPVGLFASPAGIFASPAGIFSSPVPYLLDSRLDFGRVPSRVDLFLIIFGDTSFLTPQA